MQVVIQFGGTDGEKYLHSFNDVTVARKYTRSADRAAYRCLGPFTLPLPGVGDLADAAEKVARWAKRAHLANHEMQELSKSLKTLKRGFNIR